MQHGVVSDLRTHFWKL